MNYYNRTEPRRINWAVVGSALLAIIGFLSNLVQLLGQDYDALRHLQVARWTAWVSGTTAAVSVNPNMWTMYLVFFTYMLTISVYEWRAGIIPNEITYPGTAIGFGFNLGMGSGLALPLQGAAVALIPFLVNEIYFRYRGVDGLGLGNAKMVLMIGAFWGPSKTLGAFAIASMLGACYGAWKTFTSPTGNRQTLEFGPFLAFGASLIVLVPLDVWYLELVNRQK
jgi:prepilin signal peptidase PulO-like enzyme (type II secretory pathway)